MVTTQELGLRLHLRACSAQGLNWVLRGSVLPPPRCHCKAHPGLLLGRQDKQSGMC